MLKTLFIFSAASILCGLSQPASASVMPACNVKAAAAANERFPGQLGAGQTNDCTLITKINSQQEEYSIYRCTLTSSLSTEEITVILSDDCKTVISVQ